MKSGSYIAHRRENDGTNQSVKQHLQGVSKLARGFASKLGMKDAGELLGLLHDLGKYSSAFQQYIGSATGIIDFDADDYVDFNAQKGKIDHSTAGAQLIWNEINQPGKPESITAQMLALCVASHHSGLIDCLESTPHSSVRDRFTKRMEKSEDNAHLKEVMAKMDNAIKERYRTLIANPALHGSILNKLIELGEKNQQNNIPLFFKHGLLIRFLFSCLIDADRIDTADFENPVTAQKRQQGRYQHFDVLINRLENKLSGFSENVDARSEVNQIRKNISDHCLQRSSDKPGIYSLSVPTGGGKTLASLRFALNHAEAHEMERIIYVIPFTSIIDQNAEETRKILEPKGSGDEGRIVLEHHSNLTPEKQTWKSKILSENWDAPVVYTTMVQFLETLFGAGTRGARRMHQLARSVIIFDEIQTLPINCVHLFNNAIQFLSDHCDSTIVLCTATQPLLHEVNQQKGCINLSPQNELMRDISVGRLFENLRRVDVIDQQKKEGWAAEEIADLAMVEMEIADSCLIIVNTKKAAQTLFELCTPLTGARIFHLSTSMCPAHRKSILKEIRELLDNDEPVLCVSTQLIEAGVDVDFGAVIRFTAGLDSIAQAAGRCNRNGKLKNADGSLRRGRVSIVNPLEQDEKLGMLPDIAVGKDQTIRLLGDFNNDPTRFDNGDLIGPTAMKQYFQYYFFERQAEMAYPVSNIGWDDDLLNLLSTNSKLQSDYSRTTQKKPNIHFKQAFMTAAKAFKAIDAPTRGIVVPYGKRGEEIITELCGAYEPDKQYALLREAQQYTVNVFPNLLKALDDAGTIHVVQDGIDILYLMKAEFYSEHFGLSDKPTGEATNYYDL